MVILLGAGAGVVLLYFWITGQWFAALLATPGGIFLGTLIAVSHELPAPWSPPVKVAIILGFTALAWVPFCVRAKMAEDRKRHFSGYQVRPIQRQDEPFNSRETLRLAKHRIEPHI